MRTESDLYNTLIKYHAKKWLENHNSWDPLLYLEKEGGAVMSAFIVKYGASTIIEHLIEEKNALLHLG